MSKSRAHHLSSDPCLAYLQKNDLEGVARAFPRLVPVVFFVHALSFEVTLGKIASLIA